MARRRPRLSVPLLAAAVSSGLGPAALAAGPGDAQAREPMLRRLELTKEDIATQHAQFFTADYTHAEYEFSLRRDGSERRGQGEMWLLFREGGGPRFRVRGEAESQRFGHGEITLVVDTDSKMLYAYFKLDRLHESQCIKYPFPDPAKQIGRMKFLRGRKNLVMQWKRHEQALLSKESDPPLLEVNWTKSKTLKWNLDASSKHVTGFEMRHGSDGRVFKSVELHHVSRGVSSPAQGGEEIPKLFEAPADDCRLDESVPEAQRLAEVELRPPHQKSSALNDLLLALQDHKSGDKWEQLFLALSVMTVPGDVSVLIEDPIPPDLSKMHHVRFDYRASLVQGGQQHTSEGSIWLKLLDKQRAFRLTGRAQGTKVGDLTMDLVAQAGSTVYANVNLSAQHEAQCVAYDYPTVEKNEKQHLHALAEQRLAFFAIAELDGEDCCIFVAELARGRYLHIWVDKEQTETSKILRSEVHRNGEVLRSTDILKWSVDDEVNEGVKPEAQWGCAPHREGDEQLARLGLSHPLHKKSVQLQDALYAVDKLHADFALLEILGLTGDVGIMVQEPKPPDLWAAPAVTLAYSISLVQADFADIHRASSTNITGHFAANLNGNVIQITAGGSASAGITNVTVLLDPDQLSVQVTEPDGKTSCLTLPVKDSEESDSRIQEMPGMFEGVEEVNGSECDRFSYTGTGPHQESVQFWWSMEDKRVCALLVGTSEEHAASRAKIDIPEWTLSYEPQAIMDDLSPEAAIAMATAPLQQCASATESRNSWLSLASRAPRSSLLAGSALARLAEACGVVGLLPEKFASILSRLVITSPSEAGDAPGGKGPAGSTCADFSGRWTTPKGSSSVEVTQAGCTLSVTSADKVLNSTIGTADMQTITIESTKSVGTLDGDAIQWDEGYPWIRETDDPGSSPVPVSVLSEDLQTFSFSFKSAYPLAGSAGLQTDADGGTSYSPTSEVGETKRKSHGEMRVDLASRRLYLSSSASDVSTGIPHVSSKIIVRGDQAKVYARTKLEYGKDGQEYDQCWMVNTTELPLPSGGRQPNPFQYSESAGGCEGSNCKETRVSWLDDSKRLEFFIDSAGRLVGMVLDDTERDVAAGITISDFSTRASSPEWFDPTAADWKCKDLKYLPGADHIAEWDLIRAFFPLDLPLALSEER